MKANNICVHFNMRHLFEAFAIAFWMNTTFTASLIYVNTLLNAFHVTPILNRAVMYLRYLIILQICNEI